MVKFVNAAFPDVRRHRSKGSAKETDEILEAFHALELNESIAFKVAKSEVEEWRNRISLVLRTEPEYMLHWMYEGAVGADGETIHFRKVEATTHRVNNRLAYSLKRCLSNLKKRTDDTPSVSAFPSSEAAINAYSYYTKNSPSWAKISMKDNEVIVSR